MTRLLLKDGLFFTQNARREVLRGNMLIEAGTITALGEVSDDMAQVIALQGKVVLPALINTHLHLGETIFRGRADGEDLFGYLDLSHNTYLRRMWNERRHEIHSLSAKVALIESIRHGVGTVAVSRGWNEVEALGLNGFCGYPVIKIKKLEDFYRAFCEGKGLDRSRDSRRVRTALFVQSLMSVDTEALNRIHTEIQADPSLLLFIHVAETRQEIHWAWNTFAGTPINVLDAFGLLGPNTVCIHCNHLEERDVALLRDTGAKVVCCPTANLKLKTGIPPIGQLLAAGIPLALATDGLATNNSASLLEVAKIGGLIADKPKVSPQDLLDMITRNPARVLGLADVKGSLEVGKAADVAVFDFYPTGLTPPENLVSHLIYNSAGARCDTLLIDGQPIMQAGEILTIDEAKVAAAFASLHRELEAESSSQSI
ncbi:MAG TPA: amidohydrolase family protein [Anaerolineae bacterium]|nr:amidohydrolase family protein [Anaerolineae bacterium]